MHIEILVEDASGKPLLEAVLPKLLGRQADPHTWRVIAYKGVGRLPRGLQANSDPNKRILLDQLPRLLRGYRNDPSVDAIVVVLDADRRDCSRFLAELNALAADCNSKQCILFRLAIEELEAWYLGDREALHRAYPRAKAKALKPYRQDSICGTWELLADAIHPGGAAAIKKKGWPLPGQIKSEWAQRIGPLLVPDRNVSPSFGKLRDGLRRMLADAG